MKNTLLKTFGLLAALGLGNLTLAAPIDVIGNLANSTARTNWQAAVTIVNTQMLPLATNSKLSDEAWRTMARVLAVGGQTNAAIDACTNVHNASQNLLAVAQARFLLGQKTKARTAFSAVINDTNMPPEKIFIACCDYMNPTDFGKGYRETATLATDSKNTNIVADAKRSLLVGWVENARQAQGAIYALDWVRCAAGTNADAITELKELIRAVYSHTAANNDTAKFLGRLSLYMGTLSILVPGDDDLVLTNSLASLTKANRHLAKAPATEFKIQKILAGRASPASSDTVVGESLRSENPDLSLLRKWVARNP